jgi:quercetin dioxygenase-like cupin family protein
LRPSRLRKKWVAATGVAVIGTFAAVALGSAPLFFTSTPLVTANLDNKVQVNSDRIKLQTKDPTVVRVSTVVFGAGGYSGWHHHPGFVIVSVASGSVTVWGSDCTQTTYGPGTAFVESGDDPGQVTSAGGATNYVTAVVPNVNPLVFRIEDPAPACAAPGGHTTTTTGHTTTTTGHTTTTH